jgi:hypothetical protein
VTIQMDQVATAPVTQTADSEFDLDVTLLEVADPAQIKFRREHIIDVDTDPHTLTVERKHNTVCAQCIGVNESDAIASQPRDRITAPWRRGSISKPKVSRCADSRR